MNISIRIALVEDDQDLRQSTQEYLTHAGYAVWGAGSAEDFYRHFTAIPADVVVLDIGLPGEGGLSVAALLQANPDVAVIILSAHDKLDARLAGLHAGADRYLVKPVNLAELAANIEAVGKRLVPRNTRPHLELPRPVLDQSGSAWQLDLQNWRLTAPAGKTLLLTGHEFSLLHLLVKVQGQAVPKKELAEKIFGHRIDNAADRLNVLVNRLRKKAQENFGDPLPIKTAHQIGYAFTAPVRLIQTPQGLGHERQNARSIAPKRSN